MNRKVAWKNAIIVVLGIMGIATSNSVFAVNTRPLNFSVELKPSLNITINDGAESVDLDMVLSNDGNPDSADFDVDIYTNQPGYTLKMETTSSELISDKVNPDTDDFFIIPSVDRIDGGYTSITDFPVNHWGISVDGSKFNSITAFTGQNDIIRETHTIANPDTITINVGARLDLLTAPGTYQTTVNFIVIPNIITPSEPSSITELTYLQDFAGLSSTALRNIEESMDSKTTYQLIDNRDNTTYQVGKMNDGNIWLLDNLALDLLDTDVLNNLSPTNTNATSEILGYLKDSGGSGDSDGCAYSSPMSFTDGPQNWFTFPLIYSDDKANVGVYYNFCSASAGSYCYDFDAGPSDGEYVTNNDICPAGWRMPIGGSSGEYKELVDSYDSSEFIEKFRPSFAGIFTDGGLMQDGQNGYIWSRNGPANQVIAMYSLAFSSGGIDSAYDQVPRSYGLSVRCLVR